MSERAEHESYSIGAWAQEQGQPGMDVRLGEDISEQEFNAYVAAAATYRSLTEQHTYALLGRYRRRIDETLAAYQNLERLGSSFRHVNTRIMNTTLLGELTSWLAAGRLYLVSTKDFLVTQFGDPSTQLSRFERATNRAFDTFEGYRFMYNLRDYSQHCGIPVGGTTVSRTDRGRTRVELYLSRSDLLLAHFDWSRHAKQLLSGWPEQILVMPLLDEATQGYRIVHDEVLLIMLEACDAAVPKMREAIDRADPSEGEHAAIFRHRERDDGVDGPTFAFQTLPTASDLEHVQAVAASPSPLSAVRRPQEVSETRNPAMRHADRQAAAVVAAWIEHQGSPELTATINRVIEDDGDVTPLISGLINLAAVFMAMLNSLIGSTPQSLLGSITDYDESSEEG